MLEKMNINTSRYIFSGGWVVPLSPPPTVDEFLGTITEKKMSGHFKTISIMYINEPVLSDDFFYHLYLKD